MNLRLLLSSIILLVVSSASAQVGIGNTNPLSTLDITASSTTSPANNDGILIPRMSVFPASPGATRDGMLIYYTGTGASGKGFYYWNTTSWIFLSGAKKINDLSDGKSDNDGSNDGSSIFLGIGAGSGDDSSDNENIGIGYQALENNVTGNRNIAIGNDALQNSTANLNTAVGYNAMANNTTGFANLALGGLSLENNSSAGYNTGIGYIAGRLNTTGEYNTSIGSGSGYYNTSGSSNTVVGGAAGRQLSGDNNVAIGFAAGGNGGTQKNIDNSVFLGYFSGANETGSNKLYIENSSANADNSLIYGEFDNNILRTNSEFQIGNPTGTGYAFPTVDGTLGQVLTTDGNGQISFSTLSIGVEKIDDLTDGKSDNDGTNDGSSIYLGINAGATDDLSDNRNIGIGFQSLQSNINGANNTAVGYNSLLSNTSGTQNTAIGTSSLTNNTTGFWNTGIGQSALASNVDGPYNTAVGRSALAGNLTGASNVAIGVNAYAANTSGSFNTVIGVDAANALTASNNTIIGRRAMNSHTSGGYNVAIGAQAGYYGSGIENTYIGTGAGFTVGSPTRNGSVFLGYGAGSSETTSNKLYIENSASGPNAALIYGEFDTNILRTNGEFQIGNPTGTGYAFPTTDSSANYILQTDGNGQLSFINPATLTGDNDWTISGNNIYRSLSTARTLIGTTTPGNYNFTVSNNSNTINIGNITSGADAMTIEKNNSNGNGLVVNQNSGHNAIGKSAIVGTNILNNFETNIAYSSSGLNETAGVYVTNSNITYTEASGFLYRVNQPTSRYGNFYGSLIDMEMNMNGTGLYGFKANLNNSGSSPSYGFHIEIPTTSGGTHYGMYSNVQKSNSYAAYLIGRTSLGIATTNRYFMPGADGSANQVLTTNGAGVTTWSTPTEVDGDVTNELQDLTLVGDELQISGGISANMRAFMNPKYPDGFANVDPITFDDLTGANNYTVPAGKNLYITNVFSDSNFADLTVDGSFSILSGQQNTANYQSINNPIIVGSGSVVEADLALVKVNGFLVDAYCEPININATYTVPAGKILVILNYLGFNSDLIVGTTTVYNGSGTNNNAGFISFINPIFVDTGEAVSSSAASYNINGYLIDK